MVFTVLLTKKSDFSVFFSKSLEKKNFFRTEVICGEFSLIFTNLLTYSESQCNTNEQVPISMISSGKQRWYALPGIVCTARKSSFISFLKSRILVYNINWISCKNHQHMFPFKNRKKNDNFQCHISTKKTKRKVYTYRFNLCNSCRVNLMVAT